MLFDIGSLVATPTALRHCVRNNVDPMQLVQRHASGDWGEIDAEDRKANDRAINHDLRIFSSYVVGDGKVWCITEADRSSTCILLPSEY